MKISLIIPMYNESSIICGALDTFTGYMKERFHDWEIIFVSDGSTDSCEESVKKAAEVESCVKLISYTPNRGKGYAVRQGMLASSGDISVFTDCDNAYGTDVIGRIYEMFEKSDADIIVGSRNMDKSGYEGYTFLRKVASKVYIKILNIFAGFSKYRLSDSQCGFKGFRTDAAKKIFSHCEVDRFAFDLETIMIAGKYGFKISQMPVKVINHRESKIHVFSDAFRMLSDVRKMKKRVKKLNLDSGKTEK